MIDTSAVCGCCGERESAGQCVKGRAMCACETDATLLPDALEHEQCGKCPVHCHCFDVACSCDDKWLDVIGHRSKCPARIKCRETIQGFREISIYGAKGRITFGKPSTQR